MRRRRAEVFGAEAGPLNARDSGAVRSKTTPTDPVTVVDTETERLLRDRLAQLRPGDPILGEEGGGPADPAATAADAVTWVLDPIDGTVNFVYGIPAYAASVARRSTACRWRAPLPTSSPAGCTRRRRPLARMSSTSTGRSRCGAPPSTICRWRCWAPASATQGGAARSRLRWWRRCCRWSATCGESVRGAGLVHGRGGPAGCVLRARPAGVGSRRGRADRGRGRGPRAGAGAGATRVDRWSGGGCALGLRRAARGPGEFNGLAPTPG